MKYNHELEQAEQLQPFNNIAKIKIVSTRKSKKDILKIILKKSENFIDEILAYPDLPSVIEDFNQLPGYFDFLYNLTSPLVVVFVLNIEKNKQMRIVINQDDLHELDKQIELNRVSIFDCTDFKKVIVQTPGILNLEELGKIISLDFEFKNNFLSQNIFKDFFITEHIPGQDVKQYKVIIGTKESLKHELNINLPEYFLQTNYKDLQIINLGSQTNLQNVAKNLVNRINLATRIKGTKILLTKDWGNGYWGKYITTVFETIEQTNPKKLAPKSQIQNLQQESELQNISIEGLTNNTVLA